MVVEDNSAKHVQRRKVMQIGGLCCLEEGREENWEREEPVLYGFLEIGLQGGVSRIVAEKDKNGVWASIYQKKSVHRDEKKYSYC